MKLSDILKYDPDSFSAKIFQVFVVFIVVIYFAFTSFFIYHKNTTSRESLIDEGKELSNILAHNSRLGVLTENPELLKDPIDGILQNRDIIFVQVFSAHGNILSTRYKSNTKVDTTFRAISQMPEAQKELLKSSASLSYSVSKDEIEFWTPVVSKKVFNEESLFFEQASAPEEISVIGYARLIFTKNFIKQEMNDVLVRSSLIPAFFILPAWIIIYFFVKRITKPLSSLTAEVKVMGAGGKVKKINVTGDDEVGKLAQAFNNMTESLEIREAEKQQLEEQLLQSRKMEAVGTMAGGIAHDFNNILNATIGYAELLQKSVKDDPFAMHCVEHLLASAEKGENLIKSLLAYTKKQIIYPEPANLNIIVKNILDILKKLLKENIEFRIELADENLDILADQSQIERALMNLVKNAGDAMPEGGVLTIRTRKIHSSEMKVTSAEFGVRSFEKIPPENNAAATSISGLADFDLAEISVADTGTGMDQKTKERIFDPFFTTKKPGAGTGLGLSIVYGIIKQHAGHLDVVSEPGQGTTFRIYIPLIKSGTESQRQVTEPVLPTESVGGTETILVAEDDDYLRNLLTILLSRNGYKVIEAENGRVAFDKFIQHRDRVNLLLLDVVMPEEDGKTVFENIKKMRPGIKALFMSGYPDDIMDEKERREKGLILLHKPLPSDVILREIRKALDN